MPFKCQNLITDRQLSVLIDGTGEGWYVRGQRLSDFSDVQYVQLNYRLQVQTGTGSVALRVDWQPSTIRGVVYGSLAPLIPAGPTVANGEGAVHLHTDWETIGQDVIDQGDILLRTIYVGTPGITFLVDYAMLMYR